VFRWRVWPHTWTDRWVLSVRYTLKMSRGGLVVVWILVVCLLMRCFSLRICPLDVPRHDRRLVDIKETTRIPKRIWTFWDTVKLPPIIVACVGTWYTHCPGYEITIITPETLCDYVPNAGEIIDLPFSNNPQRLADFVRLHVLYIHGGYWLDASCILFESLDVFGSYQERHQSEFVGYYLDGYTVDVPVIENWFFECIKHSEFIGMWWDEFMRMNRYSNVMAYVDHARMHNVRLDGIFYPMSYYLSMHVAAQVVIQRQEYPMDRCFLQAAESGPLQYLSCNNWVSKNAISWLVDSVRDGSNLPSLVKIRRKERSLLKHGNHLDILTRSTP
jgi:hypothetical protein